MRLSRYIQPLCECTHWGHCKEVAWLVTQRFFFHMTKSHTHESFPYKIRGVEVGVHTGAGSRWLLCIPNLTLYGVDPFKEYMNHKGGELITQERQDAARVKALQVAKEFPNFQLFFEPSATAVTLIEDAFLDFVHIDGCHGEHSVREDITLWLPKLRANGLISGHDYGDLHGQEVKKVVDDIFGDQVTVNPNNLLWHMFIEHPANW